MQQQRGLMIRAELLRRGLTMADVARRCHVNRSTVLRVVTRQSRSRRIERCIAELIGVDRDELFPETDAARAPRMRAFAA